MPIVLFFGMITFNFAFVKLDIIEFAKVQKNDNKFLLFQACPIQSYKTLVWQVQQVKPYPDK